MRLKLKGLARNKLMSLLVFCLFILVGMVVFQNILSNSFHFDDEVVVVFNRNIISLKNIPSFFVNPKMMFADFHVGGHYRPLVVTVYAICYAIGGLNPETYHLVNLIFHIGTAFLVFLIVQTMLVNSNQTASGLNLHSNPQGNATSDTLFAVNKLAAIAAGLLFLVHPFNSEAVNYVTALSSVMSGFFYLLSFYCWMVFRVKKLEVVSHNLSLFLPLTSGFYIASFLAFVMGMLSKELVITLPAVLWLYDMYGFSQGNSKKIGYDWRNYIAYIPFGLIVILPYLLMRFFSIGKVLDHFHRPMGTQLFTELPILVKHWQMFFLPLDLTPQHYIEIYSTFWSFPVILSSILFVAYMALVFIFAYMQGRAVRTISFFMLWFFIVLLPTTIIPLNVIFQENRGYVAIVGFAVIVGVIVSEFSKSKIKWISFAMSILLITACSFYTFQRNKIWKDDIALWTDALKKSPRSWEVYTALAIAYRRVGMYANSIDASKKALVLGGDDNYFIHENLGKIYIVQENWGLAAKELEVSVKGYPYKADTHDLLGTVYFKLGKPGIAEREHLEAIRLNPMSDRPYFNLGGLYASQRRIGDAVTSYKMALALNPNNLNARLYVGRLMEEAGRKDEAAEYYRQVP